MNTGLKISAFAAALAATFGTAYGVGQGIDPVVSESKESAPARHDGHSETSPEPDRGGGDAARQETPLAGGPRISENG